MQPDAHNARIFIKIGNLKLFPVNFDRIRQDSRRRNILIINVRNLIQFLVVIDDIIAVADNQHIGRRIVFHADFIGLFNIKPPFHLLAVAGNLYKIGTHRLNRIKIVFYLLDILGIGFRLRCQRTAVRAGSQASQRHNRRRNQFFRIHSQYPLN